MWQQIIREMSRNHSQHYYLLHICWQSILTNRSETHFGKYPDKNKLSTKCITQMSSNISGFIPKNQMYMLGLMTNNFFHISGKIPKCKSNVRHTLGAYFFFIHFGNNPEIKSTSQNLEFWFLKHIGKYPEKTKSLRFLYNTEFWYKRNFVCTL